MLPPLFDANGRFGCPATAQPEFRTAAQYLAHLDRLGVQRGLVWHLEGREFHPTTGNRKLIAEIHTTPGAKQRLVPAFTIGAQMLYERGAMEELKSAMKENGVRALRVFPAMLQHTLGQLEPVVESLLPFTPVLFLDSREGFPPADLIALATKFPSVPMLHMQGMWGGLPTMIDLLRRCPNVLIETSWTHTRGTIELMAREFGAERLLFGLGFRSHNGASVAEIANLELDDKSQHLVAHGNLERLLGLAPMENNVGGALRVATILPKSSSSQSPVGDGLPHSGGSLYRRLLEGQPLGVDMVDAHGHMGPLGRWVVGDAEWSDQIPDTIRRMDKIGMRTMIISGTHALFGEPLEGNRILEKELGVHGERFKGYFVFNPFYDKELKPTFDDFFSRSFFVGFKIHTSVWRLPVTDPRFEPVFEYANQHRLPILFHTWDGSWDTPSMFKDIVKRHPDVIFLMGHTGGGSSGRVEAEQLALENPNVYLEWCGSFTTPLPYEDTLRKVGADRVLFGTDGILHSFPWELGRLLSLDVPEDLILPTLGANMRGILSLRR